VIAYPQLDVHFDRGVDKAFSELGRTREKSD